MAWMLWILISKVCFCFRSSFRSFFPDSSASLFWASTTLMFSNCGEKEKMVRPKNNVQRKPRLLGWYLILVPVFGVLQILFCQVVVLVADVVEHDGQVGVVRVDLHLHLGVSDLLTQVIHLLEEAQRGCSHVSAVIVQPTRPAWVTLTFLWSWLSRSSSSFTKSISFCVCWQFSLVSSWVFLRLTTSFSNTFLAFISSSSLHTNQL